MPRMFAAVAIATAIIALSLAAPAQAGIFDSARGSTPPALAKKLNQPVSDKLLATLQRASKAGLGLGTKPLDAALQMISGPRLDTGDKVGFFYMGADFCPYCAGQRWAVILTLMRFGKFEGLQYMLSSPRDVYANTPTLSFQNVKYHSEQVALKAVETADRMGKRLMKPNKLQEQIFTTFDAPPYTPQFGGIPFIYIDGMYMLTRPIVHPQQLAGRNWQEIANTLADPQSALFQKAMPKVNLLTAAICRLDGGNPAKVCASPGVIAANGVLLRLEPTKQ